MQNYLHPVAKKTVKNLLKEITRNRQEGTSVMKKIVPFPRYPIGTSSPSTPSTILPVPSTQSYWTFPISGDLLGPNKVYVMATLNVTPDSFSDGSMHNSLEAALQCTGTSISAGADIIDIGGYSTRPRANYVSNEDEISRVVPVIQAVRERSKDALISVDTFRADVAEAAVMAGANCINDVHAFTGPEFPLYEASACNLISMRQLARNLAVPVVLMHSRGDAGSNKDYSAYLNTENNGQSLVLKGVQMELGDKVDAIVRGRGGVRRWLVMVDPGIGFSKTMDDNLEVLRHASLITAGNATGEPRNPLEGYPLLIGTSKKSFIGKILKSGCDYRSRDTEPKDRGWATAAAVACAVQQGASVVRVHDVAEMVDVVKMSSALWWRRRKSNVELLHE